MVSMNVSAQFDYSALLLILISVTGITKIQCDRTSLS